MTKQTMSECLTLLRAMPHGREQEWTDALRPLYTLVLRHMDDDLACRTVERAVLSEEWRPAPARLLALAAELAAPVPDAESAYAEIIHKAQTLGLHAAPVPGRPNCYTSGPPPMSHPIVAQIVAYCGGWEMVCTGEANYQEGLRKQVRAAHSSVAEQWRDNVRAQLSLPPEKRNPVLFRHYPPYELPSGYVPEAGDNGQLAIAAPPQEEEARPIPARVRALMQGIKALPPPDPPLRIRARGRTMTPDERARIEAEVRVRQTDRRTR